MNMTQVSKIDYELIKQKTYEVINDSGLSILPVSVTEIIKQINNIELIRYSTFAERHGLSVKDVVEKFGSKDGVCYWEESENNYIIFYNDKIKNKHRIRFTLAHELGHFALGHHKLMKEALLARRPLKESEYNKLETEANYFANSLLVPMPIILRYLKIYKKIDKSFIKATFNVSNTVSEIVIGKIKRANLRDISNPILENFKDYISFDVNTVKCNRCESYINRLEDYCIHCGQKNTGYLDSIENTYLKVLGGNNRMIYGAPLTKGEGGHKICPRCQNEEILDGFKICHVCSTYIYNECVGYAFSDQDEVASARNLLDYCNANCGCQNIPDNARFCPGCGACTSYYVQGLLEDWQTERALAGQLQDFPF